MIIQIISISLMTKMYRHCASMDKGDLGWAEKASRGKQVERGYISSSSLLSSDGVSRVSEPQIPTKELASQLQ